MGKRSEFPRRKNDWYVTPKHAVVPLLQHLPDNFKYIEPCGGDATLAYHIGELTENKGKLVDIFDVEPKATTVREDDALTFTTSKKFDYYITNPPWTRKILHPLIDNLASQRPTWLLFDADWMHNVHAIPYLKYCRKIVSVGRVRWFNNIAGKENSAWYLFDKKGIGETFYCGRAK